MQVNIVQHQSFPSHELDTAALPPLATSQKPLNLSYPRLKNISLDLNHILLMNPKARSTKAKPTLSSLKLLRILTLRVSQHPLGSSLTNRDHAYQAQFIPWEGKLEELLYAFATPK